MRLNRGYGWLLAMLVFSGSVSAANVQVDGPAYATRSVLDATTFSAKLSTHQMAELTQAANNVAVPQAGFVPLKTSLRSCRHASANRVNFANLPRPLFVVGDNQASLVWLDHYRSELASVHAMGLVIAANNAAGLQEIHAHAGSMPLFPVSSDGVVQRFGITCYPVLISKHWIEH